MTVILGTPWSSIKEVKAPFVFDVEHGIALHAVQISRASSRSEGKVSLFFSSCGRNLGFPFQLRRAWPLKTRVFSAMSALLSSYKGHLRILLEDLQGYRDTSQYEVGDPEPLSSCH